MATNPDELDPKARPPQLGMMLTPEQQRQQRVDAGRQRAAQRIQETKQGFKNAASAVGGALGTAAGTLIKAGTVVPRTIKGIATGEIPVNVSHLPDYSNKELEQRRAANWAANNPAEADSARLGMRAIADRASSAAIGQVRAAKPAGAPMPGGMNPPAVSLGAPAGTNTPAGASASMTSDAGPQGQPAIGFQRTSVDGVVGRVGDDGTMAFSNAPGDVNGASDVQMKAGRMGNGLGGLSVGAEGDSQLALDRFQRANDIRAQTIADSRRGMIGEGGGLTIVGSGSDAMDRAKERREMSIAADGGVPLRALARNEDASIRREEAQQRQASDQQKIGIDQQRLAMEGAESAANLGMRAREVANAEQTGELERQRIDMELQAGKLNLDQQRQIQQLREQLADPNLDPARREQIHRAYNTLTTPAKDRYMLQDAVMGQDALGAPVFGKAALDVTTGQLVGQGQQGAQAAPPQFQTGKIYRDASGNRARYKGTDAQGNPQWEQL